jgi:hypothetical protein
MATASFLHDIRIPALLLQLAAGQILGHELRQELFSFAAAGVIDMGPPERLAILNRWGTGQVL